MGIFDGPTDESQLTGKGVGERGHTGRRRAETAPADTARADAERDITESQDEYKDGPRD